MGDVETKNYGTLADMEAHPEWFERTTDYESRKFAMQVLEREYPGWDIRTFMVEEGGPDILFGRYPIEVKTRRMDADHTLYDCLQFNYDYTPGIDDDATTFAIGTLPDWTVRTTSGDVPPCWIGTGYYMLKASTKDNRFIDGSKWGSMIANDESLMVICRDGWWLLNPGELQRRHVGYGWFRERDKELKASKYDTNGELVWRDYIMALISFNGLEFHREDVPHTLFTDKTN